MIANIQGIMEIVNYYMSLFLYDTEYSYFASASITNASFYASCLVVNISSLLLIIVSISLMFKSLKWLFNLFGG